MSFSVIVDMVAALAVTALLAESYGMVRRRFVWATWAPIVLGILYGIMALVQMYNPIEPSDGVIVDLRNIPIALAGAFLGWRGLIPCLLIAVAVRLEIGGAGAVAGVSGMIMAGLASLAWARALSRFDRRTMPMLIGLALAMSSHLLAAFMLPPEMALWFLTKAAPAILIMNLVAVPLIGSLMERERRRVARESRLAAAATRNPDSGLLLAPAFVRDLTNAYAARSFGTFAGFAEIVPDRGLMRGVFGLSSTASGTSINRDVLDHVLEHAELAGENAAGRILVPLSDMELSNASRIKGALRDAVRSGQRAHNSAETCDIAIIAAPDPFEFLRFAETLTGSLVAHRVKRAKARWDLNAMNFDVAPVCKARILGPADLSGLFAKADFLMHRRHG